MSGDAAKPERVASDAGLPAKVVRRSGNEKPKSGNATFSGEEPRRLRSRLRDSPRRPFSCIAAKPPHPEITPNMVKG